MRLIPATRLSPVGLEAARAAMAALTLIPDTRLTYWQALAQLDGHATTNAIRGLLANLDTDQLTATIRLLSQLARILDANPAPIDYRQRRSLLAAGAAVDPAGYATLAVEPGWRSPSPLQLRILDHHLAIALTGAHHPKTRAVQVRSTCGTRCCSPCRAPFASSSLTRPAGSCTSRESTNR